MAQGLAAGVLLGSAALVGIQFFALARRGFRFRFTLSRRTEGMASVARMMVPSIAGQGVAQLNLIVMTSFASRLGDGRISALHYAQHLVLLPHGVLAMSFSTVIFPLMACQYYAGQTREMKQRIIRALRPVVFLRLPAAVVLIALRQSLVQVLFQYGEFSSESTNLVAEAVEYFAIGLLVRAVVEVLTRSFYAMRDTRTPLIILIVAVLLNIPMGWLLASHLGHGGLALSLSLTYIVRMIAMLTVLVHRTGSLGFGFGGSLPRMLAASAALGATALAVASPLASLTDPANGRTVWTFCGFVISLGGLALLYLFAARALRIPELSIIAGFVQRRVKRLH